MTQTFDLIVRGGEVVNHAGRGFTDIGVRNGKIVAIGDLSQASAGEIFDATGLTVLPGVIDSQVHFREPGLEWKEDLESGSRGAALGGVVAVFEMPNTEPTTTDPDALADKLARAKGRMHTDHAFYVGGTHENATFLGELERLPGCCGIKVFMGASTGTLLVQDDEGVENVLRHVNRRAAFHSEDEYRLAERRSAGPARRLDQPPGSPRRPGGHAVDRAPGPHRQEPGQAHPRAARDHPPGDRLPGQAQGRGQRRGHAPAPDPGGARGL
jgi:dihydroorotase